MFCQCVCIVGGWRMVCDGYVRLVKKELNGNGIIQDTKQGKNINFRKN